MKLIICEELEKALKQKPFFNCVGGCGVDTSNGENNCMASSGIWFKYCPFCGKKIISMRNVKTGSWIWYEEDEVNE